MKARIQYGRSVTASDARMLWSTGHGSGSSVKSYEDACRIAVEASMSVHTAQAETLKRMDRDDVIDGYVDMEGR